MNPAVKFALALVASSLFVAGAATTVLYAVWSTLQPAQQVLLAAGFADSLGLVIVLSALLVATLGVVLHEIFRQYVVQPRRLAEETFLILSANTGHRITCSGPREMAELGAAINALAARLEALQRDVTAQIAAARGDVEREKNRLAALMSELSESVIVCNTAGRILLYNQRVQQLLGSAATSGTGRDTPDLIGLGRSLFTVVDRNVVAHALDHIQHRLQEGDRQPVAVFITATRGGQSIRARMAPVLVAAATDGGAPAISGFVLMLEDVKRDLEIGILRDRFLTALTEGTRSSLANIRAAVENIAGYPQMEPAQRQQFLQIMSGEAEKLSSQLDSAENAYADDLKSEWPLATMLGHDLLSALRRTIESRLGLAVTLSGGGHSLWLKVDSFLLVEACAHLAGRLRDERGVRAVELRLDAVGQRPQLDMQWHGAALAIETALAWENEPLNVGGQQHAPTFKSIVERHGGEAWYKFDTASQTAYFRVLLRPAEPDGTTAHAVSRAPSRPIFYDFDLFHQPGLSPELDERLLIELAYTVFDTETSGLEPSAGDEIVSIGAVRIVNARVLVDEVFDQLVDPRRPLSMASVNIHGITSDMLQGQPTIEEVLPAFHRFCEDTVLVAHNAAFDMRFLQMKESAAGVRFTQPVLDTLMLAAVVHPNQDDNTLEAIAGRLGVNIIGRHTAPGDAIVTAEIFLKLLPLLAAQGIKTLHDARQASQQTPYARLHY